MAMTCRVGSVDSLDLSVSVVACAILLHLNSVLKMMMTVVVVDDFADFVDAELAAVAAAEVELPIVSAAVRLD